MNTIKITLLALTFGLMSFENATISKTEITKKATNVAIVWKSETIEVGEIAQGVPKKIEFEFKNVSKKDVIITNVQGSCGCTATDYTKTPIAPGKSGKITATYNAAAVGGFYKTVSVTTNAEEAVKVLTLKGTVVAKS